jgi:hypothetical protein
MGGSAPTEDAGQVAADAVPTYEAIREANNARVEGLGRVWARVVARLEGKDAAGKALREQAEGHLQIERPEKLALTLGKLGETKFHLGSDEERYWWIDLTESGEKLALVGKHELVSEAAVAAFGLPIHPLDLIELLAITPLPEAPLVDGKLGAVFRARGVASVGVNVPATWGFKRLWVNPQTFEPERVEVRGARGELLAVAMLSDYEWVGVESDDVPSKGRIATRVEVRARGFDGSIRLSLAEPKNRVIKSPIFDFDKLVGLYRVSDVRSVDEWVSERGGAGLEEDGVVPEGASGGVGAGVP